MTALRRPIQVIAVTFAAVLFFVLAWAVLGFSGPATAIRQAGDLARNQRYTEAIKLLNRAENELGPPETAGPDLESLLDVRQFAYTALDNAQLAIADLQRLIILRGQRDAEVGTTRALRRKLVRQRLLAGQIAIARNEARRLYTEDPTDGRAAELVGEALQASYQGLLADVVTRIERAVTPLARADVVEPLRRWLYRDADDPGLEHARERFQQALAKHSAHDILVEDLDRDLEKLRAEVLRARQMYRTALASETAQPVAAYRGEAFALEESGKVLEQELLAAAYLMRFDHVHSVMAATDQVKLLVDTGRPRAAIEAFRRFLPIDSWGARVQDGRLDQRVGKLFRAVAPAYAAVGDDTERAQLAAEVQSIEASGLLDLGDDFHWVLAETAQDLKEKSEHLFAIYSRVRDSSLTLEQKKQGYLEVGPRMLEVQLARGGEAWPLNIWRSGDPDDPDYLRAQLREEERKGNTTRIRSAWNRLRQRDPTSEEYLMGYANARDAELELQNRGSKSLLARCVTTQELPDSYGDPIVLLPLAEKALALGTEEGFLLTVDVASKAIQEFHWAKRPRELLIRALDGLDLREDAARAAQQLRERHRDDPAALALLVEMRHKSGQPTDDLVGELMTSGLSTPEISGILLRTASQRIAYDVQTRIGLARAALDQNYHDPEVVLEIADVQLAAGLVEDASFLLFQLFGVLDDPEQKKRVALRRFWALASALDRRDPQIETEFYVLLNTVGNDPGVRVRLAEGLAERGLPDLAYEALLPVLEAEENSTFRDGSHFVLAGQLQMQSGRPELARQTFLRAIPLPGGEHAAVALSLMLLFDGEQAQASEALANADEDNLTVAVLSMLFGNDQPAKAWLRNHRQPETDSVIWTLLKAQLATASQARDEKLLIALACNGYPGFELTGVRRTREVLASRDRDDPQRPALLTLEGAGWLRTGNVSKAIERARMAIRLRLDFAPAYGLIARVLQEYPNALLPPELKEKVAGLMKLIVGSEQAPRLQRLLLESTLRTRHQDESQTGIALAQLAALWQRDPRGSEATNADVLFLLERSRPDLAAAVADSLRRMDDGPQNQTRALWYHASRRTLALDLLQGAAADALRAQLRERGQSDLSSPETADLFAALAVHDFDESTAAIDKLAALRVAVDRLLTESETRSDPVTSIAPAAAELTAALDAIVRDDAAAGEDLLRRALRLAPGVPELWLLQSSLHEQRGELAKAAQSLSWTSAHMPQSTFFERYLTLELRRHTGERLDEAARATLCDKLGPAPDVASTNSAIRLPRGERERITTSLICHARVALSDGRADAACELFEAARRTAGQLDQTSVLENALATLYGSAEDRLTVARDALSNLARRRESPKLLSVLAGQLELAASARE